jgi:hypothetical protein
MNYKFNFSTYKKYTYTNTVEYINTTFKINNYYSYQQIV